MEYKNVFHDISEVVGYGKDEIVKKMSDLLVVAGDELEKNDISVTSNNKESLVAFTLGARRLISPNIRQTFLQGLKEEVPYEHIILTLSYVYRSSGKPALTFDFVKRTNLFGLPEEWRSEIIKSENHPLSKSQNIIYRDIYTGWY